MQDSQLIALVLAGDPGAERMLYDAHVDRVFRLAYRISGDLDQAKDGYADEERRGVPVTAPHRNYRDANHKPELVCALTEFDGLCDRLG